MIEKLADTYIKLATTPDELAQIKKYFVKYIDLLNKYMYINNEAAWDALVEHAEKKMFN